MLLTLMTHMKDGRFQAIAISAGPHLPV